MNVCFKNLFSNQLPIPGFKHSSPERATVVAIGVEHMTRFHINELLAKNALKAEEIRISLDSKSENP